jgi:hypothetical protein
MNALDANHRRGRADASEHTKWNHAAKRRRKRRAEAGGGGGERAKNHERSSAVGVGPNAHFEIRSIHELPTALKIEDVSEWNAGHTLARRHAYG